MKTDTKLHLVGRLQVWKTGELEVHLIAITPSSTLIRKSSTCWGPIYRSNRSVWKLIVLDRNTWYHITVSPVSWRIYRPHLCREVRPPPAISVLDMTKTSYGVASVLELWGIWSTASLPLLSSPLWPEVIAPDWVLSMGWIELFDIKPVSKQMTDV